jgi:hypothetical protein
VINLTEDQKFRISQYTPFFIRYLTDQEREADLQERQERTEVLQNLLSKDNLNGMTEVEFGQVISMLWASLMWGNKGFLVDRLINDNGIDKIKNCLKDLLWGIRPLAERYDEFRNQLKGFGPGMITEILSFVHPDACGLWNDKARKALIMLDFERSFPIVKKYQITGREYEKINELLHVIKLELINLGIQDLDLLGIDYFLFEVQKIGWPIPGPDPSVSPPPDPTIIDFDHAEMIDKLLVIGQFLGFEVHKEKPIARGAKVDVVWQAKIANLGVVTYVYEVQRRGAIDSLILNLQRAQNNPSVQRLVVVALPDELERIEREIVTLPESFRKSVVFMEVKDVMKANDLVIELSIIINKLDLVKAEFGS